MPTAKTKKPQAKTQAKNSDRNFLKSPVGIAILLTLLVVALVFMTGKSQEKSEAQKAGQAGNEKMYENGASEAGQMEEDKDKGGKKDEDEDEMDDAGEEASQTPNGQ